MTMKEATNEFVKVCEQLNIEEDSGYLYYTGTCIGHTYLLGTSTFSVDLITCYRITLLEDFKNEVCKSIKYIKEQKVKKKLEEIEKDFV